MTDDHKKIELRSEEIEDILGKVPGWLTRNGITMLLVVITILLLSAWVFKIPDVKKAEITVSSAIPPADIEARADGKILQLFVEDNEKVERGKVLAVIENPADFEDVMAMEKLLVKVNLLAISQDPVTFPTNGNTDLGMIQGTYAGFQKKYRDYFDFILLDYHKRKVQLLQNELEQYRQYSIRLEERAEILEEEYRLSEKQYARDSTLFLQGVVSESNFEEAKSQMLSKRVSWHEVLTLTAENEIKIAGIREIVLDLELKRQESYTLLLTSAEEALNNLNASIAAWKNKYLIITPIDGIVTFNQIWSENQNVKSGDKVMSVVPNDNEELLGKILLPLKGAGEVLPGQQVNIRFENFPYMEYGMVKGIVQNVSKVPQNNHYTVEVSLPEGLTTYYGYHIDFSQNMKGQAEILTDKMRLMQRIFNPVRNSLTRQREM
ncbi:HlyD family secretion protein [Bacteroidota bacterium]